MSGRKNEKSERVHGEKIDVISPLSGGVQPVQVVFRAAQAARAAPALRPYISTARTTAYTLVTTSNHALIMPPPRDTFLQRVLILTVLHRKVRMVHL